MQHFYAHFPPFLYQFCIKKEKTFLPVFPFSVFLFCFFHWFYP